MKVSNYETIVFDCDGVLLNSNKVKTDAFYKSVLKYGEPAAKKFIEYHKSNGGISRYKKFEFFFKNILSRPIEEAMMNEVLESYASYVREGLMKCDVAEEIQKLKMKTPGANWLIVSGGDQSELRDVFSLRGLDKYFDGGIFGSPDTKELILSREYNSGSIKERSLFVGDSRYDHVAANSIGMDFVFVSGWSEFKDWKEYCTKHKLKVVEKLKDLMSI